MRRYSRARFLAAGGLYDLDRLEPMILRRVTHECLR
jgi:hypothetical protein